jgi:hypothetical protein
MGCGGLQVPGRLAQVPILMALSLHSHCNAEILTFTPDLTPLAVARARKKLRDYFAATFP